MMPLLLQVVAVLRRRLKTVTNTASNYLSLYLRLDGSCGLNGDRATLCRCR